MVLLEIKVGEIDYEAFQTKEVNDELDTRLDATGSRLLGSWSELADSRNTLDAAQLEMADIRRDLEDVAASSRM